MGLDDANSAPGWVWVGFLGWLGIFFLFPVWTIWVGMGTRKEPAGQAIEQVMRGRSGSETAGPRQPSGRASRVVTTAGAASSGDG